MLALGISDFGSRHKPNDNLPESFQESERGEAMEAAATTWTAP